MNNVSFKSNEQTNTGSALASSLISTGVTAGVGALGGAGVAKVATLIPPSKPTAEKIIEELYRSGDEFVKNQVHTIENVNKAELCESFLEEIDDVVKNISENGLKKGLFKKTNPTEGIQEYLKGIMDLFGEKVDDGVELTKEQVKNVLKNKRKSLTNAPREKFEEVVANANKALKDKVDDFLKIFKKGDKVFDDALKATHKMKKDLKVASFAKWGAIIALGLSLFSGFKPKAKAQETNQA